MPVLPSRQLVHDSNCVLFILPKTNIKINQKVADSDRRAAFERFVRCLASNNVIDRIKFLFLLRFDCFCSDSSNLAHMPQCSVLLQLLAISNHKYYYFDFDFVKLSTNKTKTTNHHQQQTMVEEQCAQFVASVAALFTVPQPLPMPSSVLSTSAVNLRNIYIYIYIFIPMCCVVWLIFFFDL